MATKIISIAVDGSDVEYVLEKAYTLLGLTYTVEEINKSIDDSHTHENIDILNAIINSGDGNKVLSDDGTYKDIIVLSETAPENTNCLWIDTTNKSSVILKVWDDTQWISVSGSGGGGSSSSITISEEDGNAIQNKDDGIYVEDKTTVIDNMQTKVNMINIAQKTVNSELEHCECKMDSNYTPVVSEYLPFKMVSGNMESDSNEINLKANRTYSISICLSYVGVTTPASISYSLTNVTTSTPIQTFNPYGGQGTQYEQSYSMTLEYTPEEDCNIAWKVGAVYSSDTINANLTICTIHEIGRMITVDPVEYVNSEKGGIEDTPVGHIIPYMGTIAPKHYLSCDGSEYNIADYPYLAQHFIDNYGVANQFGGDGTTTFTVPKYTFVDESVIPIMSSNSQNGFVASASSIYSETYPAWKAFTKTTLDDTDSWATASNQTTGWIQIKCPVPILINKFSITARYIPFGVGLTNLIDFCLQGSNDGANWTDLKSITGEAAWTSAMTRYYDVPSAQYLYYRVNFTKTSGTTYVDIGGFDLYHSSDMRCIKYEPTYYMYNAEKGEDGVGVENVTKDDSGNILFKLSDGTTKTIGKLPVDIQGDFVTESGFGNLRYYSNKFQYYDTATSSWVDIGVTSDNQYVIDTVPQSMKSFTASFDLDSEKVKLLFEEPDDTVIDNQTVCFVTKVVIRRKVGSAPESITDGDLAIQVNRKDFGAYKSIGYLDDETKDAADGTVYYYRAFVVSATDRINDLTSSVSVTCDKTVLFGFKINQAESDPSKMITYIEKNADYTPAHMDYDTGVFDYGSWESAWFIKNLKPCVLKFDGSVAYTLDKDDYSKKSDGTTVDITSTSLEGNVMIGIPKVYWKVVNESTSITNVYFSNTKIDDDFHCWSHIDCNNNEIDYCYIGAYLGYVDSDSKLRSLSGNTIGSSTTMDNYIKYAKANNSSANIWFPDLFADRMLISLLLMLISKSTDTQTSFGLGVNKDESTRKLTGTLDNKSLFYGTNAEGSHVKLFGIESYWGYLARNVLGAIYNSGMYVKLTYGTADGSSVNGFSTSSTSGYLTQSNSTFTDGYISKMTFNKYGMFVNGQSGSTTTYYCDKCFYGVGSAKAVGFGSLYPENLAAGVFAINCAGAYNGTVFTGLACKPIATV